MDPADVLMVFQATSKAMTVPTTPWILMRNPLTSRGDHVIVRGSEDFTFTQINWTRTQVSVQFISSVFQCNLAARHPARNRQILQEKVPQELHVDKTE